MRKFAGATALVALGLLLSGCQRTTAPPAGDAAPMDGPEQTPDAAPISLPDGAAAPRDSTPAAPQDGSAPAAPGIASAQTFTARGNEPFWSVRVTAATQPFSTLIYSTPDLQPGKTLQARRRALATGVAFDGQGEGRDFTLELHATPCEDTMSGEPFEFSARFTYGDETVTGCARRGP